MTRPLRVGIQLPEVEREVRWPEYVDLARAIEDAGFDAIWVGEHLLYRWPDRPARGPWEAWTLMGALAAATSRVSLGPLVAATSFHNPALLAKQAATIDEIASSRVGSLLACSMPLSPRYTSPSKKAPQDVTITPRPPAIGPTSSAPPPTTSSASTCRATTIGPPSPEPIASWPSSRRRPSGTRSASD